MTPQEISDYKNGWKPGFEVQVDVDSADWGKTFCRRHYNRENWSFEKFSRPDDSHTFFFEEREMAVSFLNEYRQRNDRFPKNIIPELS